MSSETMSANHLRNGVGRLKIESRGRVFIRPSHEAALFSLGPQATKLVKTATLHVESTCQTSNLKVLFRS